MRKFIKYIKEFLFNPMTTLIPLFFMIIFFPEIETDTISSSGSIEKIVSLSPAITRQIIDLDAEHLLVGVTAYHPPLTRKIDIVGTLVLPNIEKIVLLKPNIVLLSEEDNKVQFNEMLNSTNIRSHTFGRNDSFESICKYYLELATLIDKTSLAKSKLKTYSKTLRSPPKTTKKMIIALFVSNKPLIGASNKSYIGKIISHAGAINCLGLLNRPYPIISMEHLVMLNPDIIISILYHGNVKPVPFNTILKEFPELTVMKRKSIYIMPSDYGCSYTPQYYVKAYNLIVRILEKEIKKRNEKKI